MKLLQRGRAGFVFELQPRERELLGEALRLYPLVPVSHYRISRESPANPPEEHQQWLEEALTEQRSQNQEHIENLLNSPGHWHQDGDQLQLKLKATELDWLLQVLNDVRVGCWLVLGQPDGDQPPQLTSASFHHLVHLEVCGAFESILLGALGVSESPDWAEQPPD